MAARHDSTNYSKVGVHGTVGRTWAPHFGVQDRYSKMRMNVVICQGCGLKPPAVLQRTSKNDFQVLLDFANSVASLLPRWGVEEQSANAVGWCTIGLGAKGSWLDQHPACSVLAESRVEVQGKGSVSRV